MANNFESEITRITLENRLFEFWERLPRPKLSYSEWWYGEKGVKAALDRKEEEN